MTRWLAARRVLDRVVAAVLTLLTAPLMALCAWRVRAHDGGPPFVQVTRAGRDGRPFGMWKVRTMRPERDDGLATGTPLTGADDDRITPVGARLRSYHLDELPQLLNVVAGEMTLFGPRPEAPEFVDAADESWRAVLALPPGIAGVTQLIVGAWEREVIAASPDGAVYREQVVPVKLAIDRWYVEHATPFVDLAVGVALLRHLLDPEAQSALARRIASEVPEVARVGAPPGA